MRTVYLNDHLCLITRAHCNICYTASWQAVLCLDCSLVWPHRHRPQLEFSLTMLAVRKELQFGTLIQVMRQPILSPLVFNALTTTTTAFTLCPPLREM